MQRQPGIQHLGSYHQKRTDSEVLSELDGNVS
jgi:hypothetical protein